MKSIRKSDVLRFVLGCLNEVEADGYQQREEEIENGEFFVPDDWTHDGQTTITLDYNGEKFLVTVSKPRTKQ